MKFVFKVVFVHEKKKYFDINIVVVIMGKTRKPRYRIKKQLVVSASGPQDGSYDDELGSENHSEDVFVAIRDQLQSANLDEKMCGLQSMAFLSHNKKKAEAMCESDIIRIASPLLVDTNKNIQNAVAGALRNVSLCGTDICEILVEQDVLTPLLTLVNEYTNDTDWVPNIDRSVNRIDQLDVAGDTFLHAVNLVWNLCESTSVALQHFNQTNILEGFIRFLNYSLFGIDLGNLKFFIKHMLLSSCIVFSIKLLFSAVAVAQCLLVISEDNPVAWRVLNHFSNDIVSLLTNVEDSDQNILLRAVLVAILSNVPSLSTIYTNQIFNTLNKALDINHRMILGKLTSSIPINENGAGSSIDVDISTEEQMEEETTEEATKRRQKQDLPTAYDIEVKQVGWILESQRIAAETITNLCSTDDSGNIIISIVTS